MLSSYLVVTDELDLVVFIFNCVGPREVSNLVFYAQSTSMVISGQRPKTKDMKMTRDKIDLFLKFFF